MSQYPGQTPTGYQQAYAQPQYTQPPPAYGQPVYQQQPQYQQPVYGQPVVVGQPIVAGQMPVGTIVQGQPMGGQTVVVLEQNSCPAGGAHFITEDFNGLGICLAIVFFPIGLLCCLAMREQRCVKCNTYF